jgi:hypothetical protein
MFFKEERREREREGAEEGERGASFPLTSIFKTDYPCNLQDP